MSSYKCKQCNRKTFHDEQWDSYFCAVCNQWNENKCSDSHCCYCVPRPDRPLTASIHEVYLEAFEEIRIEAVFWLLDECHNEGIY